MADLPPRKPANSPPEEGDGPATAAFNKKMLNFFASVDSPDEGGPSLADLEDQLAADLGIAPANPASRPIAPSSPELNRPPPVAAPVAPSVPSAPLPLPSAPAVAPLPQATPSRHVAPLPQAAASSGRPLWPLALGFVVMVVVGGLLAVLFLNGR